MNRKLRFTLFITLFAFANMAFAFCERQDQENNPFCQQLNEFNNSTEEQLLEDEERLEISRLSKAVDDFISGSKFDVAFVSGNVLSNDWACDKRPCTEVVSAIGISSAFLNSSEIGKYGTLSFDSSGNYTYALNSNSDAIRDLKDGEVLTEVFDYTMQEPWYAILIKAQLVIHIRGDSALLSPALQQIKDGIVAQPDTGFVTKNGELSYTGNTALNDFGVLNTVLLSSPTSAYGNLSMDNTGVFTYTVFNDLPEVQSLGVGENIIDRFSYLIVGEFGFTSTSTITITIQGNLAALTPEEQAIKDSIVALSDEGTVIKNNKLTVSGNVLFNDLGAINDVGIIPIESPFEVPLTAFLTSDPTSSYGHLELNSLGSFTYTLFNDSDAIKELEEGDFLVDTFMYSIEGFHGYRSSAKLTIYILGNRTTLTPEKQAIRDNVFALTDQVAVIRDSLLVASGNVTDNDSLGLSAGVLTNGTFTAILNSAPNSALGSITFTENGSYTYVLDNDSPAVQAIPSDSFEIDAFTYTIEGEAGFTDTAKLLVLVLGNDAITSEQTAIVALDDIDTVVRGIKEITSGDLGINDLNATNFVLTSPVPPAPLGNYGTFVMDDTGLYTYTLHENSTLLDNQCGDGPDPVVEPVRFVIDEFTYSIEAATGITNPGDDSLFPGFDEGKLRVYVLCDQTVTSPEEQTIKDATFALDDQATVVKDVVFVTTGDVNSNDSGALTTLLRSEPNTDLGSLSFTSDGKFEYVLDNASPAVAAIPDGGFALDVFEYIIVGQKGYTDTAFLTVIVLGKDAANVAQPALSIVALDDTDSVTRDFSESVSGSVADNDFSAVNFKLISPIPPAPIGIYGTLIFKDNGDYNYSLSADSGVLDAACAIFDNPGFVTETFRYAVEGENGLTHPGFDEATLTIYVLCDPTALTPEDQQIKDSIFALDDQATVIQDILFVTTGNVGNNDSGALTTILTSDANTDFGSITFASDGSFTYVLDNNSLAVAGINPAGFATDEFTYKITGLKGFTDTAKLSIIILGKDAANVAQPELSIVALDDTDTVVRTSSTNATGNVGSNDFGAVNFILTDSPIGTYGSISLDSAGDYSYTLSDDSAGTALDTVCAPAAPGFVTETYDYAIQGTNGIINPGFDTATLTIYIICDPNADPNAVQGEIDSLTALPDEFTLVKNTVVTVSGNVNDNDEGALTTTLVSSPVATFGNLQLNSAGEFTYNLFNDLQIVQDIPFDEFRTDVYTYKVTGAGGFTKTTTITFRILGNATALVDNVEVEINDRSRLATPIASASIMKGHLLSSSDKDWYVIQSQGDKIVHLELCPQGSSCFNEGSWVMYVFDGGILRAGLGAGDDATQETSTIPLRLTRDDTGADRPGSPTFSNHMYLNYRADVFSGAEGTASLIAVIDPCFGDENTLDIGIADLVGGETEKTLYVAISSPLLGDSNSDNGCGGGSVVLEKPGPSFQETRTIIGPEGPTDTVVTVTTTQQFITAFPFRDDQYAFTVTERTESPQALSITTDENITLYNPATGSASIAMVRVDNDLLKVTLQIAPGTGALGAVKLDIASAEVLPAGLRGDALLAYYNPGNHQVHLPRVKNIATGQVFDVWLLYHFPTASAPHYVELLKVTLVK